MSTLEAAQHRGGGAIAEAQASSHAPTKHDNRLDDEDEEFPPLQHLQGYKSLESISTEGNQHSEDKILEAPALDILGYDLNLAPSESSSSAGDSQGTKERPVILDDDGSDMYRSDAPNPEGTASYKLQDNVEDRCLDNGFVSPPPPSEQGVLTTMPAQDQPRFCRHPLTQDENNMQVNGITRRTSKDPVIQTLGLESNKNGAGWGESTIAELEREVLAFGDREDLLSPAHVIHYPVDQEPRLSATCQSILQELRCYSPTHPQKPHEKSEEVAVEAIASKKGEDRHTYQQHKGQGEKRQHQDDNTEISNSLLQPAADIHNPDTNIEVDKDTQPVKRQKLLSITTDMPPTPPPEQSPDPYLGERYHSNTPPSTTQQKIGDTRSPNDHGQLSDLVDIEEQHATSQSPLAATQTASIAEYQEWPFQGILKRTRIGNETIYNLEFQLPCTSEHLKLPINPEALDMSPVIETSSQAAISHHIPSHSKIYPAAVQPQTKGDAWTTEEEQTVIRMKKGRASWKVIHDALPHRSIGTIQVRYSTKLKHQALLSVTSEDEASENNTIPDDVIITSKDREIPLMSLEATSLIEARRQEDKAFDRGDLTIDPVLRNIGRSKRRTARISEEEDIHTDKEE